MIHPQYFHQMWRHMAHVRVLVRHWSRDGRMATRHLRWGHRLLRRPGR